MKKSILLILFLMVCLSLLNAKDSNGVYHAHEVDVMPDLGDIFDWIALNQRPTSGCKEKVIVKFVVLEDGTITDVKNLRPSKNAERNNETMRLMGIAPKVKPAIKNGKPVKCDYMIPVILSSLTVTDNGKTIDAKYEYCEEEHIKWSLNRQTQTLSISGSGEIRTYPLWKNVQNIILAADVDDYTFIRLCPNVRSITVSSANTNFSSVDGVLYNKARNTLLAYPKGRKRQNFTIPNGVEIIDEIVTTAMPSGVFYHEAFDDAQIDTLFIPSSVKTLPSPAFNKASVRYFSVSEVNKTYTTFDGVLINKAQKTLLICPQGMMRQHFSIPIGVETIADSAFNDAQIGTLVIPSSMRKISWSAFKKATIGCFVANNNPLFTVRHHTLCCNDSPYEPYITKNIDELLNDLSAGKWVLAKDFYNNVIEIAAVNSLNKDIYKSNKPSVFVITTEEKWCIPCLQGLYSLKLLSEKYKGRVNFYQIEASNPENEILKKYYSALFSLPHLYVANGIQQGDLTYLADHGRFDIKWLEEHIEEMLSGKHNR